MLNFSRFFKTFLLLITIQISVSAFASNQTADDDLEDGIKVPLDKLEDNIGVFKWISPSIGYGYQFMNYPGDPSRYLRREAFKVRLYVESDSGSGNIIAGPKVQSQFIRPFEKTDLIQMGKDFISDAKPYHVDQIPHSALKAKALKTGDYYSFLAQLALQLKATTAAAQGIDFMGLQYKYFVSGDFKIELYRLKDAKVKVILSSLRQRSHSIHGKMKIIPDVDVFGVDEADDALEDLLEVELMDWTFYKHTKGNMFSISYTYDLDTKEGAEAFEALFDSVKWKKKKFSFKASQGSDSIKKDWVANTKPSEEAAIAGTGVVLNSESLLDYIQTGTGLKFDLKVFKINEQRHFMELDYRLRKTPKAPFERFRIGSLAIAKSSQFLFKFLQEFEMSRNAMTIFSLNKNSNIDSFEDFSYRYERTDKKLTTGKGFLGYDERPSIVGQMRRMLPEALHSKVQDFVNIYKPKNKESAYVSMTMSLNPHSLFLMQELTGREIDFVIDDFINNLSAKLDSKKKIDHRYYGLLEIKASLKSHGGSAKSFFSKAKMKRIKQGLKYILTKPKNAQLFEKQWQVYKDLRKNMIFRDIGSALIVRLLQFAASKDDDGMSGLYHFRLRYKSKSSNEHIIEFGDYRRPAYTKALIQDRDRVLNREYNPLHFEEKIFAL